MSEKIRKSKFLSLILRHKPEAIGLTLDANGWALISDIVEKSKSFGKSLTKQDITTIVKTCDKQRYAISPCGDYIRANQGHSIQVDVELEEKIPPEILFHGTATKNRRSIESVGLKSGSRQHVHLSTNHTTAFKVGSRHGFPIILEVLAGELNKQGHKFFLSANGVWLTEVVPPKFIKFP